MSFTKDLNEIITEVIAEGGTGYRWGEADDLVLKEVPKLASVRFKRASGSSRAANTLIENPGSFDLVFVVVTGNYSADRMLARAKADFARVAELRAAAIADQDGAGKWAVRYLVVRPHLSYEAELISTFPNAEVVEVETPSAPTGPGPSPSVVTRPPLERATPTAESLVQLREQFASALSEQGLVMDNTTRVDLLASILGSQAILFAGPSGTGKSTAARALMRFFASSRSRCIIEGRRQWLGPEDLVGYRSAISNTYVWTPFLQDLIPLSGGSEESETPIVIVEEVNLSPIEGYLGPVVHGLSHVSVQEVAWPLYVHRDSDAEIADRTANDDGLPPSDLVFIPYPRWLGTINVDASAHAPAPKVAARACVVVLEPQIGLDVADSVGALLNIEAGDLELKTTNDGLGAPFLQDPLGALKILENPATAELEEALQKALTGLGSVHDVVSHRDVHRAVAYMSWYVLLGHGMTPTNSTNGQSISLSQLAAENALLHFVLPRLHAEEFRLAVDSLMEFPLAIGSDDAEGLGGTLLPRIERLRESANRAAFGGLVDFWSALS